jgi:hypothetical protein
MQTRIIGGQGLSDHHPISAICKDTGEKKFSLRYRMNTTVMKDKNRMEKLDSLMEKELEFLENKVNCLRRY